MKEGINLTADASVIEEALPQGSPIDCPTALKEDITKSGMQSVPARLINL